MIASNNSIDSIQLNYREVAIIPTKGPSWPWSHCSWIYNYLCNRCLSWLMLWVRIPLRVRCTTLCDKVCQWLAAGRWFSLGTPVSSNKTNRHDIAEILLKVALSTINQPFLRRLIYFNLALILKVMHWSVNEMKKSLNFYPSLDYLEPATKC
jgi:hypothetical protein